MYSFIVMIYLFFCFYVAFNTVQVISQQVVGRAEETSTYSWPRLCIVNCQPMASNYQLSHLRQCQEPNPGLRGGRQGYHSATVAPYSNKEKEHKVISDFLLSVALIICGFCRLHWQKG